VPRDISKTLYDTIIIGAGPAGLTASIYLSYYKVSNLIISDSIGGKLSLAHKICNFPPEKEITGTRLKEKILEHTKSLKNKIILDEVIKLEKKDNIFSVITLNGKEFKSKTILLAFGTRKKKLDIFNEERYIGKGVSYCFSCDSMFFKNKKVAIIGNGPSAVFAVLCLIKIAKKVYQICLEDSIKGETFWIERILNNPKVEVLYRTKVTELGGENKLEFIILNKSFKNKKKLPIDGVFIEIGFEPDTTLTKQLKIKTDKLGYIVVNKDQSTNISGVWASGDITTGSNGFKQIITACAEGGIAAKSIFVFLENLLKNQK